MEKLADVITRFEQRVRENPIPEALNVGTRSKRQNPKGLLPDRHPTRDFFVADILDWALKDDRHSMEHPMFSLSKKPDTQVRHYIHKDINVTITPSVKGMATI